MKPSDPFAALTEALLGTAAFTPDPEWPARDLLHRVYYAQREYQRTHGHWAAALADLGLKDVTHPTVAAPPKLETTTRLFEAHVELKEPGNGPRRWCIRQDARRSAGTDCSEASKVFAVPCGTFFRI